MSYEIELKSLLVTKEKSDQVREATLGMGAESIGKEKQFNHYFVTKQGVFPSDKINQLKQGLYKLFADEESDKLEADTILAAMLLPNASIRTRLVKDDYQDITFLVCKQGKDSSNGNVRKELELSCEGDYLEGLDQLLVDTFFDYQAKWSRERESYKLGDFTITLDKNAGYGWLCELEIMIEEGIDKDKAEMRLRNLIDDLDLEELPKDRLNRMFEFYNKNWKDFYGMENYFVIN